MSECVCESVCVCVREREKSVCVSVDQRPGAGFTKIFLRNKLRNFLR